MSNQVDKDKKSDASLCYADMGFMFKGSEPTHIVRYNLPCRNPFCCGRESFYGDNKLDYDCGRREGTEAVMENISVEIAAVDGNLERCRMATISGRRRLPWHGS